jgi:hypothetical protein
VQIVGDSMRSQQVGLFGTGTFVPVSQKVHPLGRVHCSPTAAKLLLVACCSQEISGHMWNNARFSAPSPHPSRIG